MHAHACLSSQVAGKSSNKATTLAPCFSSRFWRAAGAFRREEIEGGYGGCASNQALPRRRQMQEERRRGLDVRVAALIRIEAVLLADCTRNTGRAEGCKTANSSLYCGCFPVSLRGASWAWQLPILVVRSCNCPPTPLSRSGAPSGSSRSV